ncbi:MAG: hypothetical protein ACXWVU_00770 [Sulfuricurvum sp.]
MMFLILLVLVFTSSAFADCNGTSISQTPIDIVQQQRLLTVYNYCEDDLEVYYGPYSLILPEECRNGSYCEALSHTNPAIWVSKKQFPSLNFGARTLVELNFLDPKTIWWDISLVKGYNVPAQIKVSLPDGSTGSVHPETTCTSVNCADAYWICDTAWNNLFHPVYNSFGAEAIVDVTFCPKNATDTIPLHPPLSTPRKIQGGEAPFYCSCSEGVPRVDDLVPPPNTILAGSDCGPIFESDSSSLSIA